MPHKLLLLALLTTSAIAQSWDLSGPGLGLDYNSQTRTLRPILGIPGAATLGDPIDIGIPVTQAYLPPAGKFAFVQTPDSDTLSLYLPGAPTLSPLPAAPPDRLAFSPNNATAVLYYQQSARLLTLTGLPGQPRVLQDLETSLPGPLAALAVNDSGSLILAAPTSEAGGGVFLVMPGGGTRNLLPSETAASLSFSPNQSDALVAAPPSSVFLLKELNASEQIVPFSPESDALAAAALSTDGQLLISASTTGNITLTDLATQTSRTLNCVCQPDSLTRLTGAATFRLNSNPAGPIWILEAADPEPRIVFVPRGEEQ